MRLPPEDSSPSAGWALIDPVVRGCQSQKGAIQGWLVVFETFDVVHVVVEDELPDDPLLADQIGVDRLRAVPRGLDLVHPPVVEAQHTALQPWSTESARAKIATPRREVRTFLLADLGEQIAHTLGRATPSLCRCHVKEAMKDFQSWGRQAVSALHSNCTLTTGMPACTALCCISSYSTYSPVLLFL